MRIFLGALLVASLAPSLSHAQPQQPIVVAVLPPAGPPIAPPAEMTSTNWTLLAPGIALFAGGWLIGWATTAVWNLASADCHRESTGFLTSTLVCGAPHGPYGEGDWQMAIPIVGPFLATVGDDTFRGNDVLFPIAMEALQLGGLALAIAGLATPRRSAEAQIRIGLGSIGMTATF